MTSDHVVFFDTTLRDGEQSPGCSMTTQEKLTMAHALEDLGVDIIEAGFAMASEGDFAAIATITQAIRKPRIASLARAKTEDIEMAARALQFADRARIHVFLASSDLHLEYKLKITRQQALDLAGESVRLARSLADDVEFSPEDATRSDRDYLVDMVRIAVEAGATTINMPDTVGYTTPEEYGQMFREVRQRIPAIDEKGVILSSHCHDDLGLAVANSLAAISAGARQVECTVNGIGERAGNASLEELAAALTCAATAMASPQASSWPTSTPQAKYWARSSHSNPRPTRPSSAPMLSLTSQAFINMACWPILSATRL
jgi:2-isopropylmalate synthase